MSNRAMRRAAMRTQTQKSQALIASYTKQQRIAGLIQNGISPKDLEQSYEEGRQEGFKQAGVSIIRTCYAAICIALHDEFDF